MSPQPHPLNLTLALDLTLAPTLTPGLLSTAEPDSPPVVIATEEFSISAKLVSKITEVSYPYPYPYPYPKP